MDFALYLFVKLLLFALLKPRSFFYPVGHQIRSVFVFDFITGGDIWGLHSFEQRREENAPMSVSLWPILVKRLARNLMIATDWQWQPKRTHQFSVVPGKEILNSVPSFLDSAIVP